MLQSNLKTYSNFHQIKSAMSDKKRGQMNIWDGWACMNMVSNLQTFTNIKHTMNTLLLLLLLLPPFLLLRQIFLFANFVCRLLLSGKILFYAHTSHIGTAAHIQNVNWHIRHTNSISTHTRDRERARITFQPNGDMLFSNIHIRMWICVCIET